MHLLAPVFAAVGAMMIGLAIPLVRRRVRPNALYGLRVPATFADEWVWYEANALSGRDLLVLGAIEVAFAIVLPRLPQMTIERFAVTNGAFLLLAVLSFGMIGWKRANRLLEARRAGGELPR